MQIINERKKSMEASASATFLGLSGTVWCIFAGFGYGFQNCFAKLAYEAEIPIVRFILMRHVMLVIGSYTTGELIRGVNFDLRTYDRDGMKLVFMRTFSAFISKSSQYAALAFIPLTVAGCISFTTTPIFAFFLAFVLIREKLNC